VLELAERFCFSAAESEIHASVYLLFHSVETLSTIKIKLPNRRVQMYPFVLFKSKTGFFIYISKERRSSGDKKIIVKQGKSCSK
jgi:hypothetical protein